MQYTEQNVQTLKVTESILMITILALAIYSSALTTHITTIHFSLYY